MSYEQLPNTTENVTIQTSDETTDVFKTKEGRGEYLTDKFGSVATFMAMVPQGVLGALLADKIAVTLGEHFKMPEIPLTILRIGTDGFIFITAEEGKRRLVRFFNEQEFRRFGRLQYWKDLVNPNEWTLGTFIASLINTTWSLIPSATFAYLAKLSFEGISSLLNDYNTSATDFLARLAKDWRIQAPFMGAAFLSNILGFPNIHKGAGSLILNAAYYTVENPKYRKLKETISLNMEATRLQIKALYERGNTTEAKALLSSLNLTRGDLALLPLNELREVLLRNFKNVPREYVLTPESWIEFLLKQITGLGLTAPGIAGLYNFVKMATNAANLFGLHAIAPGLGWIDYISMSALAFSAIYSLGNAFIERCFGRHVAINIFSTPRKLWILGSTVTICLLGGAPNAYQSLAVGENIPMQVIAAVASFLIEVFGYLALTRKNHMQTVTQKNPDAELFHCIDEKLRSAIDLGNATENEVQELAEILYAENSAQVDALAGSTEQQADHIVINMPGDTAVALPKQYRASYLSAKDTLSRCCFWKKAQGSLTTETTPLVDLEKQAPGYTAVPSALQSASLSVNK